MEPSTSTASSSNKRKRSLGERLKGDRLTYSQKLQVIAMLDSGESQAQISRKLNMSQPSVSYIKKNKENILAKKKILDERCIDINTTKRFTNAIESELEGNMCTWFSQVRAAGIAVSGRVIQEAAASFNKKLDGPKNFQASKGYLYRFQKRHGLCPLPKSVKDQEEKLSSDAEGAAEFHSDFSKFVQDFGYDRDCIYNVVESVLLWKALPNQTLIKTEVKSEPGQTFLKDLVTIIFCSNASGTHKLPLFMIGKSEQSRCLNDINMKLLPIIYTDRRNAWIDSTTFLQWYTEVFLPEISLRHQTSGKKCLLILDSAPTRPPVETLDELNNLCSVICLPPNVTSLIQPMDQSVIQKFKRVYRTKLVQSLLLSGNEFDVYSYFREMSLYKCIMFASEAWNSITPGELKNAWNRLFVPLENNIKSDNEDTDITEIMALVEKVPELCTVSFTDITSWLNHDDIIPGCQFQSDNQIESDGSFVKEQPEDVDNEDEGEALSTERGILSAVQAANAFEACQKWCLSRWDLTPEQEAALASLQILKEAAANIAVVEKLY